MSETIISAVGIGKVFRRYASPAWQALDALGFPVSRKRYEPFAALQGIDFEVRRGERVALIGRNGAGKSTLLRIISGQMQPTTGKARVRGRVHALMELGTGFHPDFTGIENIRSALAYNGVPEREIRAKIDEIVDFSELEEFIHRPVTEYSAGMYARLAFAVQTSITPDILVIDEILGAGDAYFVGKSIQRMKALTAGGATVLFVSHDMSSVQVLCDRAIWLQRGGVRMDGDTLDVSKAYMAQVREEEEARLRARARSLTRGQSRLLEQKGETSRLLRLNAPEGPPKRPLWLAGLRVGLGTEVLASLMTPATEERAPGAMLQLLVDSVHMNWGEPAPRQGRQARPFGDFGGSFGHAPFSVALSDGAAAGHWIELDYLPSEEGRVTLDLFEDASSTYTRLIELPANPSPQWTKVRIALPGPAETPATAKATAAPDLQPLDPTERYGSGEATIAGLGFYDADGQKRHTLISGQSARATLAVYAERPVRGAVAVVAIYRPDGTCALQVSSNREGGDLAAIDGQGWIDVAFDPLYLGPGDYIVSVALFKELDLAAAAEPPAYDLHDRCYPLKVLPPEGIGITLGLVNQPARWALRRSA